MPPDLLAESLIPLSAVARMFPGSRGAAHIAATTVLRWCTHGAVTPSGARVRLEHVRVGSRLMTSADAVRRFVASLTAAQPHVTQDLAHAGR